MSELLPALDDIDYIHRYAWFDGVGRAPLASSALFDADGNITPLGELYAGNKPNEAIGPGQDTEFIPEVDEDELLVNGGFETGTIEPWQGFKNGIYTADPRTGGFAGRIENGDGSLYTVAPVEAGKTYVLKFATKWAEAGDSNVLRPVLRNDAVGGGAGLLLRYDPVPTTDQWEEATYEYEVPDGVTDLRIVFYKANGNPPLFLDDVSLKLKE